MQSHHMGYYLLWSLLALNQDLVARLGHPWNLWKKLSCIGIIMQASLDWNMEWYSECTQLQLTCATGTAVLFNQGWASYYITAKTYKMTMSAVSGSIEQVGSMTKEIPNTITYPLTPSQSIKLQRASTDTCLLPNKHHAAICWLLSSSEPADGSI